MILSSYMVGLGLHNLEGSQEPGSRMLEAHLSIQHPNYNDPSFANDLMLIKLNESVMESNTIRRIPVATQCPTPGDICLVSGWGRLKNGELPENRVAFSEKFPTQPKWTDPPLCAPGKLPSLLQCVNLSVASEETCRLQYDPVYHLSMFCAGGGQDQKDTCNVRYREGGTVTRQGGAKGIPETH